MGSDFAEFYALYPRRVGRRAAQKAWEREIKSGTPAGLIMDGLRRQLTMLTRRDPQFIPHPATWLNAARWEDEDVVPPPRPSLSYQRNADSAHGSVADQLFGSNSREDERYGQRSIDAEYVRH